MSSYKGRDARTLSDRELLLLTYENGREVKQTVGALIERVVELETKVEHGIPAPKVRSVGIPAAVAAAALAVWEVITRISTQVLVR